MIGRFASLPILLCAAASAAPLAVLAQSYATGEAPYDAFAHHAPPSLNPGAYRIKESLELPNIDDLNVTNEKTLCLVASGGSGKHGFQVMSENNPLRGCPMVNVKEEGSVLTFDIKCPGSNLAKASASYLLMGDAFRGRIAMTMGGKNMTMTEVQSGRRIGDCPPPS